MFGFRLCKRNRLSSLRLLVVFLCICFVVMLLNNMKPAPEIKDVDFMSDMSLDPNTDKQLMNIAPIPRQDEADISKELGKNEVAIAVDTDPPQRQPTQSQLNHQTGKYYNVEELRRTVKELNEEQRILNLKKFPKRSNNSIVIVVQVHSRAKYLLKLIQSLRNTRGISDALLIFSHDYFASEINNLVRGIDFCQVLQIYFPYSQQLHPDEFPGTDPDDCRRNIRKEEALALGCKNAEHPDMYGHYREAKFTVTKHHWWWKANRVFQHLRSTRNHQGLVLFVEEDHYVSPDFYKVLQRVYSKKKTSSECQEHGCDIVTLGDYRKIDSFQDVGSDVQLQPWKSTENNMGMSFDRTTWNKIIRCHNVFCTYDDYNWDWTLMRMSKVCFNKQLTVLLLKAPRIFHLGTCGLHHKSSYCDVETVLDQIKRVISNSEKVLNPKHLVISIARPWIQGYIGQPNGGWGDKRDHKLCMQFVKSTEK